MNQTERLGITVAVLALALLLAASPSGAITNNSGISVHPKAGTWFTVTLARGESYPSVVVIENHSAAHATGVVYAADAFTTPQGGFGLMQKAAPGTNLPAWTTLHASRLDLAPGDRIEVPFQIVIPKFATPGDYAGGIIFERDKSATSTAPDSQTATNIIERIAARVYLNVAGVRRPGLSISSLRRSGRAFRLTVQNTGNMRMRFDGMLSVHSSWFGRTIHVPFSGPSEHLNPGDQVTVKVNWPRPGWFNKFTATAVITYADSLKAQRRLGFLLIPWMMLLIGLLGLAIIAYALHRGLQWLRKARHALKQSQIPSPDQKPAEGTTEKPTTSATARSGVTSRR